MLHLQVNAKLATTEEAVDLLNDIATHVKRGLLIDGSILNPKWSITGKAEPTIR